jgi:hypothetical protein
MGAGVTEEQFANMSALVEGDLATTWPTRSARRATAAATPWAASSYYSGGI